MIAGIVATAISLLSLSISIWTNRSNQDRQDERHYDSLKNSASLAESAQVENLVVTTKELLLQIAETSADFQPYWKGNYVSSLELSETLPLEIQIHRGYEKSFIYIQEIARINPGSYILPWDDLTGSSEVRAGTQELNSLGKNIKLYAAWLEGCMMFNYLTHFNEPMEKESEFQTYREAYSYALNASLNNSKYENYDIEIDDMHERIKTIYNNSRKLEDAWDTSLRANMSHAMVESAVSNLGDIVSEFRDTYNHLVKARTFVTINATKR